MNTEEEIQITCMSMKRRAKSDEDKLLLTWLKKHGFMVPGAYCDMCVTKTTDGRPIPPAWLDLYVWEHIVRDTNGFTVRLKPQHNDVTLRQRAKEWMLGL